MTLTKNSLHQMIPSQAKNGHVYENLNQTMLPTNRGSCKLDQSCVHTIATSHVVSFLCMVYLVYVFKFCTPNHIIYNNHNKNS